MSQEPVESETAKPGCLATILGAIILFVIAVVVKVIVWRLSER